MTERLYYTDAYLNTFIAQVVERLDWEGQPAVILDRTAFYPTSGGQPADHGTLDGIPVVDVLVRETDAAMIHILSRPLPDDQNEVHGEIDWQRRFDHMQQHTGQHILSAAFEQMLQADTVGFHLGADVSTIDLNVARLAPEAIWPVEEAANQVVWENRPVTVRIIPQEMLPAVVEETGMSLRRPPAVSGPVRLVTVADFDINPCGGTHVAHSGEIGIIKIVRLDYRGDTTRVEFLCGHRALRDYRAKNDIIHHLSGMLTVGYWELTQAIERLQAESKHWRHKARQLRRKLLPLEAEELAQGAQHIGAYRVIRRVWEASEDISPEDMRGIARSLAQHHDLVALLATVSDERIHFCFTCAEGAEVDMVAILRNVIAPLGGRGGGRSHLAQGSAPVTDVSRVRQALADFTFRR